MHHIIYPSMVNPDFRYVNVLFDFFATRHSIKTGPPQGVLPGLSKVFHIIGLGAR